jgi:hypothetical protein
VLVLVLVLDASSGDPSQTIAIAARAASVNLFGVHMNKLAVTFAGGAFLVASGAVNAAVIDDFNVSTAQVTHTVNNGTPIDTTTGSTGGPLANIIGGTRGYSFTTRWGGGAGSNTGAFKINDFGDNTLTVDNATNVDSDLTITWDANGAGLGGADLLDGTGNANAYAMVLDVPSIDANGVTILFTITDTNANVATGTDTFTVPGQLFIPYADFSNAINVDFASVSSIVMTLSGGASWDGAFRLIESSPTPSDVPVPGTLALIGLGLLGFGARRRMQRA